VLRFLNATSKPHRRVANNIFNEHGAIDEYTVEVGQKGNENLDSYNWGLIDHNDVIGLNRSTFFHVNWVRWGAIQEDQVASGDFVWRQALVRGSDRAVYLEDNTFTKQASGSAAPQITDTQFGGMVVIRYNTIQSPWMSTHSGCTNGGRHTPWHEIYRNTFVINGTAYGGNSIEMRSASGVVWGNTQASGSYAIAVDHERSYRTTGHPSGACAGPYAGIADGTRAFDQNTSGQLGWRAFGQPGWGPPQNTNMSGTGLNAYTWSGVFAIGNTAGGATQNLFIQNNEGNSATHMQFGRELFNEANVTIGTLAARPSTCSPGDATGAGRNVYVSNNENPRGNSGGYVIYACMSTNVWTKHYEPFTYPHPLLTTLGDGGGGSAPVVSALTCNQTTVNSPLGSTLCTATASNTPTSYTWSVQNCTTANCKQTGTANPATYTCACGGNCSICVTATNATGTSAQFCTAAGYLKSRYRTGSGLRAR
jgi:hypothetical protein